MFEFVICGFFGCNAKLLYVKLLDNNPDETKKGKLLWWYAFRI